MTDERWLRVKALFQAAVERPLEERAAFLAAATGDDAALRREVESLLASDTSYVSFLDQLPVASASMLAGLPMDPTSSHTALAAGRRVGPYEVVAALGAGAMGEVYRARDTKLNRTVALKVLPARFALDPDRLARFTREAQLLAALNHPNIAAIYGLEESHASTGSGHAAVQALVLELIEGPTLEERIGSLSVAEALTIAHKLPTHSTRRTRRASSIATSSRRISRSLAMGWSRCSTSGSRRCGTAPHKLTSRHHQR